jgi:Queuosine biosynthesis protein QueC
MIITCGKPHRTIEISLPATPAKIGIFISGGMDSALLYFLLLRENQNLGNIHEITPLTIIRKEGSKYFAKLVIAHVNSCYNIAYTDPLIVGDNTLPEEEQVKSGVHEAWDLGFQMVYVGMIEQLPQHMIDWTPIPYRESAKFRTPLKTLDKSYIVDLIKHYNQEALFYITHSCSLLELGRCNHCNGCNERTWGFDQLGLVDPGTI